MREFLKPPKSFYDRHIFDKTLDEFVREVHPLYEEQYPLFKKFGLRRDNSWIFVKGWEKISKIEKWKYVALCNKYWLEYRSTNSKIEDKEMVFHKTLDKLVQESHPNNEKDHPIFEKFGMRTKDELRIWKFNNNWKNFSEIEKWKYIALCAIYWNEFIKWLKDYNDYDIYLDYLKEIGDFGEYKRLRILENRGDFY